TAVIVSANSHLRAATGGAYEVAKAAGQGYEPACNAILHAHPDGLPQGSAWIVDGDFKLTGGSRRVIQAIPMPYPPSEPIRATPEIVYHAARNALAAADAAGIDSIATYLWVIRDGYGTARPPEMASALIRAGLDHGREAVNLGRIAICEQSSDHTRYWLAV